MIAEGSPLFHTIRNKQLEFHPAAEAAGTFALNVADILRDYLKGASVVLETEHDQAHIARLESYQNQAVAYDGYAFKANLRVEAEMVHWGKYSFHLPFVVQVTTKGDLTATLVDDVSVTANRPQEFVQALADRMKKSINSFPREFELKYRVNDKDIVYRTFELPAPKVS